MTNNNNDPAGSPAGDDLRDTIDGIGQDTDEILDILRDGRSTDTPRPTPAGQSRPRRSRNAVIDDLVDDITSQVTRDLADAMPPPEAPTDPVTDRQMPPRQRDARGRWTPNQPPIPATDTPTTDPAGTPDPEPSDTANADDSDTQTRRRDSRGRWVRDDPPTTDISSRNQDGDSRSADTEQLGRDGESPAYWDRLAGAVGQGMQDASQGVDPTIEALREAGVFKAVSWVFGSKKDKVPKEQGKHNRVVERLLKRLVGQSEDSSRSGGLGMMLLRLAPFLIAAVLAGLGAMAPAIAVAIAAAVANSIGGLISGLLGQTETGQKFLDKVGELTARTAAALGNDEARAVVDANDAADDAQRYANRERNGNWGSTDRIYEAARSYGLGGLFGGDNAQAAGASGRPIGWLSSKYEGDYGSVARDNNGSDAYGRYQFNDKAGGLKQFFDANPQYRQHFAGLTPSTKAFGDKWKALSTDPDFRAAQHHAAKLKFYDPQVANATSQGFKLDNEGVREALFSASIQHGGVAKIVNAAGQQRGFKSMSPEQQINAFYDARIRYVNSLSSDRMSDKDKRNAMARYARERKDAIQAAVVTQPDPIQSQPTQQAPVTLPTSPKALAEHAEQQPAPAPTVNLGSNSTTKLIAPSMPYLPIRAAAIKLPAQPAVAQRLNTPAPPAPTSSSDDSMTQNVADRQLAHLITGGLGMGGQVG